MTDVKLTPAQREALEKIAATAPGEEATLGPEETAQLLQLHDLRVIRVKIAVTDLGREVIANG